MTTPIGYSTLQIIPSLDGVSAAIDKQLGGTMLAAGKRGGQQFAKGAGDGLKDLQREADAAGKAYEKMENRAKDALGKVRIEEERLTKARAGGKADQIVAAEERLAKARRDSARASKEAEAHHSSLLSAQKRLGDSSGDLGGKFSGLSDGAARVGTAITGMAAAAAGAAAGGVALIAAGAVTATRQLYELGAAFDDVSDNLRIKTGATGATLDSLNASVANLGKTVPVSLGQLGDVVAETNRNLHLTGPALESVAGTIANLGKLTGDQVNVRELGKAFRGFGVDAKDQVPALDALYQASQRSGISVNDLIATAAKGGPSLRQLGLGFGESAALVAQFEEAGLDGDKAMAGLTKGLGALAKAGQTGKQALQETFDRIKALAASGDDASALNLSNRLFGTKGGAQFFEAIKTGAIDLDTLSASMSASSDTIAQAAQGTADWSERWQLFKNDTSDALQPLSSAVFDFVNVKLDSLADWVSAHRDEIVDAFVGIGEVVIQTGADVLEAVGEMVEAFGELVGGIGNVQGAVLKFESWQAKLRGDTALADELHKQSEEAFGWGESLKKAGQKMREFSERSDALKNDLRDVGDAAKDSGAELDGLRAALANPPAGGPGWFGPPAQPGAASTPGTFTAGSASLIGSPIYSGAATQDTRGGVLPGLAALESAVEQQFPGSAISNDYRKPDGFNEHSSGSAVDIAVNPGGVLGTKTAEGQALGNAVNQWLLQNAAQLGLQYTIWQGKNWNPDGSTSANSGAGVTGGHWDHVHARVKQSAAGALSGLTNPPASPGPTNPLSSTGQVPDWDAIAQKESGGRWGLPSGDASSTGGLQIQQPTWEEFGGKSYAASPWQASKEQQIAVAEKILAAQGPQAWGGGTNFVWKSGGSQLPTPAGMPSSSLNLGANMTGGLVNAFGADFKPGIGTPGYDEYGEPGYYRTDPKELRNAQRRAEDAQQAIADADQRIIDAKAAQAEIENDILATAKDRAQAAKDVAKAERAAQDAREGASDAAEAAAEAAKGRFTRATKADKSASGSSFGLPSLTSFSGIGSALGEFAGGQIGSALDVFGVGDSPGWLQALGGFASGISIGGSGFGGAAPLSATSVMGGAPPMPFGATHTGSGAQPGPAVTYNIAARDTEDAFIRAQRQERERSASLLARF